VKISLILPYNSKKRLLRDQRKGFSKLQSKNLPLLIQERSMLLLGALEEKDFFITVQQQLNKK
jgi:hypothetical protein